MIHKRRQPPPWAADQNDADMAVIAALICLAVVLVGMLAGAAALYAMF